MQGSSCMNSPNLFTCLKWDSNPNRDQNISLYNALYHYLIQYLNQILCFMNNLIKSDEAIFTVKPIIISLLLISRISR